MEVLIKVFWVFALILKKIHSKPIFIFNHFRHGARAPLSITPSGRDMFGNYWDVPGELTNVGIRMQYILGLHKRERYRDFLPKEYDPKEIYVASTDVNRTIQSAFSQLQGMYPPSTGKNLTQEQLKLAVPPLKNNSLLKEEIKNLERFSVIKGINLIPVHSYCFFTYQLSMHLPQNCPHMIKIKERNLKENKVILETTRRFNKTYGEKMLKYFNIKDKDYFANMKNLIKFADEYLSDYTDQRDLSKFEKGGFNLTEIYEQSKILAEVGIKDYIYGDERNEVALMDLSNYMKELLYFMTIKVNDTINNVTEFDANDFSRPRFVMLSGHDTSIAAMELFFQEAFNLKEYIHPIYAANMEMNISLQDGAENKPHKTYDDFVLSYKINENLIFNMPFSEFKAKIEKKIWSNKEIFDFCYNYVDEGSYQMKLLARYLIGTVIALSISLGILLIRLSKRNITDYEIKRISKPNA